MTSTCYDSSAWHFLPRNSQVCLYRDGEFAAPLTAPGLLQATAVRWITIANDYAHAALLDWEQGNPCFTALGIEGFVRGRAAMNVVAIPYVDRANAAAAMGYLSSASLLEYPGLYWWIPTLDGRQWTAAELAADLAANWDAPIPAARLWGNQWNPAGPGRDYDTSTVYGDFV